MGTFNADGWTNTLTWLTTRKAGMYQASTETPALAADALMESSAGLAAATWDESTFRMRLANSGISFLLEGSQPNVV